MAHTGRGHRQVVPLGVVEIGRVPVLITCIGPGLVIFAIAKKVFDTIGVHLSVVEQDGHIFSLAAHRTYAVHIGVIVSGRNVVVVECVTFGAFRDLCAMHAAGGLGCLGQKP